MPLDMTYVFTPEISATQHALQDTQAGVQQDAYSIQLRVGHEVFLPRFQFDAGRIGSG